jgi:hypothetical protein
MIKRSIATLELLLIFPATLFMSSLFVRQIQPQQYQPAHTAQAIVEWFSARPAIGLHICLIALPLSALVIGAVTVLRAWQTDPPLRQGTLEMLTFLRTHLPVLLVTIVAFAAACILATVAVHVITD